MGVYIQALIKLRVKLYSRCYDRGYPLPTELRLYVIDKYLPNQTYRIKLPVLRDMRLVIHYIAYFFELSRLI